MVNNSLTALFMQRGNIMQKITGGCQCGTIRYSLSGPMLSATICHCRMCQKAFGAWGAALVEVPLANVQWTKATPQFFNSSPIVERGFCKNCGTPLYMYEIGDLNIEMAIGTLDNPNAIPPLQNQIGVESKVIWFDAMSTLPSLPTSQTRLPEELKKLTSLQHADHD
jgi:hypothetical protein